MSGDFSPSARSDIAPFIAMDVLRAANEHEAKGASVLHMEVGEPGVPAPRRARQAAAEALEAGRIGYTEALGIPQLREAIAESYRSLYDVDVPPRRVLVTTGSSAGFNLVFLAGFDVGDRIAIPTPGYPCYRNIMRAFGLEPVEIETGPESRWALTPQMLEAAHRERPLAGVLVASPANPSGTVMTARALAELVEAAEDMGLWFISDEIYHRLTYGAPASCALATSQRAIVINSFSKYYCMTGWRIGWMVAPEPLLRPMERLAQNLYISAPTLSQHAALAALGATDELEAVKAVYERNRSFLLDRLPGIGLADFLPADGAFYIYADVGRFTDDSTQFARRMLRETGVAVTPGADFDPARGARFIRLSFAGSHDTVVEAVERLGRWLG